MSTLQINFTDSTVDGKDPILLPRSAIDNSTSLVIHGQGSVNYGADLWSNMLHLMEHFCSPVKPNNPTEGQIWYDPINKCLQVYSKDDKNQLNWYKIYVDNPYGNGPSIKVDDLISKMFEGYLPITGGQMTGVLKLTPDDSKYMDPISKKSYLTPTSSLNQYQAASRIYVDSKIAESFDKRTQVTQSKANNDDYFYTTIGDTFIFQGKIRQEDMIVTKLVSRSNIAYGVKFECTVFFPTVISGDNPIYDINDAVLPDTLLPKVDELNNPLYSVFAFAELGHTDTSIDEYFKTRYSNYPVVVKNKTNKSVTFVCRTGQLVDSNYYPSRAELRPYKNTEVNDINSETIIRHIKFKITGKLANVKYTVYN